MDTEIKQSSFEGHALVELMGHRRHAGFVTTEHIGAAAFLKVVTDEVPATRYTLEKDAWIDGDRIELTMRDCPGAVHATIAAVTVEQRNGRWGWVVEVGA